MRFQMRMFISIDLLMPLVLNIIVESETFTVLLYL